MTTARKKRPRISGAALRREAARLAAEAERLSRAREGLNRSMDLLLAQAAERGRELAFVCGWNAALVRAARAGLLHAGFIDSFLQKMDQVSSYGFAPIVTIDGVGPTQVLDEELKKRAAIVLKPLKRRRRR